MKYWLLKTEPGSYSIDDFKKDTATTWNGVRNYQARNLIRDGMKNGDLFLFYHSGVEEKGVSGIGKILDSSLSDALALDKKSEYYDSKATQSNNQWLAPKVSFVKKFRKLVTLHEIKLNPKLGGITVAKRGMRLSIQQVSEEHFQLIKKLGE